MTKATKETVSIVSKQLQPNGDVFVQYLKTYNYFNSDGTKKLPKLRHKNKHNNNKQPTKGKQCNY